MRKMFLFMIFFTVLGFVFFSSLDYYNRVSDLSSESFYNHVIELK